MSRAKVEIIEQPAEKSCRFRYESEGRFNSSLLGINSTQDCPSYPKIRVHNFNGEIICCVTCVTEHRPYKQHPHKLSSGKNTVRESGEYIWRGMISQDNNSESTNIIEFKDIGIVFVKKQNIVASLNAREHKKHDPTGGLFEHKNSSQLINLQCVRLCFQVLGLLGKTADGRDSVTQLGYVITHPIRNKKCNAQLKIIEMSADTSSALGGERIILLCDKVRREDISIVFFEQDANRSVIWKKEINYKSSKDFRVHHQTAISFLTPAYRDYDIGETRKTFVQLHRPSDREFSEPSSFEFIPNAQSMIRKRRKPVNETVKGLVRTLNSNANQFTKQNIKTEKPKYVPNTRTERVLTQANVNVEAEMVANNQPLLIDFGDDEKENVPAPQQMHNCPPQSVYPPSAQWQYENHFANYSCNTPRLNEIQPYYYQQYPQNVDSILPDPSRPQMPYSQRPASILPNMCQPQPHQQQLYPMNGYAEPNDYDIGGYAGNYIDPTTNHAMINPTVNYHNNIAYQKHAGAPVHTVREINRNRNDANQCDLEYRDKGIDGMSLTDTLNELLAEDIDDVTNSMEQDCKINER